MNAAPGTRWLRQLLVLAGIAVIAFCSTGCATVPAYRRERVADRIMSFGAEAKMEARLMKSFEAREGSTGGIGGAGGGCACK